MLHAQGSTHVKMRTFEVWDRATGALVAGELGYACGDVYTSLSGFSRMASAGAVQCAATAKLLARSGYVLWDLGMELPYKTKLGARFAARRVPQAAAAGPSRRRARLYPINERERCRRLIDCPRVSGPPATIGAPATSETTASTGHRWRTTGLHGVDDTAEIEHRARDDTSAAAVPYPRCARAAQRGPQPGAGRRPSAWRVSSPACALASCFGGGAAAMRPPPPHARRRRRTAPRRRREARAICRSPLVSRPPHGDAGGRRDRRGRGTRGELREGALRRREVPRHGVREGHGRRRRGRAPPRPCAKFFGYFRLDGLEVAPCWI